MEFLASRGSSDSACWFLVFPGQPTEAPEPGPGSAHERARNDEICQRLEWSQAHIRQIPVREGPDELAIHPHTHQNSKQQGRDRHGAHTHAVNQHNAPMVDRAGGWGWRFPCRRLRHPRTRDNRRLAGHTSSIQRRHRTSLKCSPYFRQAPKGHVLWVEGMLGYDDAASRHSLP